MKSLGFAAAALAAALAVAPLHGDEYFRLRIGNVRPALDLRSLDSDKPVSWADLEGRVVVIDKGSRRQPGRPSPIPPKTW